MNSIFKFFIGVFVASIAFAASATETIKIGVSGPFTGGSAPMGISMRDGLRMAASEINAAGGVLGRRIQLVERDDQASPTRGVRVAQELIAKDHVVATVGYVNTGVALGSQKFYQDAKIPVLTAVACGSAITRQFLPPQHADNYVFRFSASDTVQAHMIVEEAVTKRGFKKVAIFADSTSYGQGGRADLEKALTAKGMQAVAVEKFEIKDVDMTAQLRRARAAGAEAILTYGIGPELAQIAIQRVKMSWNVPIIGSWTLSMDNFIENAGPFAEGAAMPQTFVQAADTPKRKAFLDAFQRTYTTALRLRKVDGKTLGTVERIPSPVAAAQAYDAMYVLAAAIRQSGSTEGVKIREALENLQERIDGVVMAYDRPFSHDKHEAVEPRDVVMGKVKDGLVMYADDTDIRFRTALATESPSPRRTSAITSVIPVTQR